MHAMKTRKGSGRYFQGHSDDRIGIRLGKELLYIVRAAAFGAESVFVWLDRPLSGPPTRGGRKLKPMLGPCAARARNPSAQARWQT